MQTQITEVQSRPQADGDGRPFNTHGYTGPVRVHMEKSGPAFSPECIKQRDAAVTALVEPMARMLYQAMQAQHLGAFDGVEFDDLSTAAKQRLVNDARCALHLQSPLYRSEAERQAKVTFQDALETTAMHYHQMNPVVDDRERERRRQAMAHVIRAFELVDLSNLMFVAHRMALTSPLPFSEQRQVTLTALRGMF